MCGLDYLHTYILRQTWLNWFVTDINNRPLTPTNINTKIQKYIHTYIQTEYHNVKDLKEIRYIWTIKIYVCMYVCIDRPHPLRVRGSVGCQPQGRIQLVQLRRRTLRHRAAQLPEYNTYMHSYSNHRNLLIDDNTPIHREYKYYSIVINRITFLSLQRAN